MQQIQIHLNSMLKDRPWQLHFQTKLCHYSLHFKEVYMKEQIHIPAAQIFLMCQKYCHGKKQNNPQKKPQPFTILGKWLCLEALLLQTVVTHANVLPLENVFHLQFNCNSLCEIWLAPDFVLEWLVGVLFNLAQQLKRCVQPVSFQKTLG